MKFVSTSTRQFPTEVSDIILNDRDENTPRYMPSYRETVRKFRKKPDKK